MRRIRLHTQGVAIKWLLSYISVLLIPVIVTIGLYYFTENVINSEIDETNSIVLHQVQQTVDNHMNDLKNLCIQIELNGNLQSIVTTKEPFGGSEFYTINELVKNLMIFKVANGFMNDFVVYLNNQDSFVTPNTYYDDSILNEPSLLTTGVDYGKLAYDLKNIKSSSIFDCPGTSGKMLVYCEPVISSQDFKIEAVVAILIDRNSLLDNSQNIKLINNGDMLILGSNNNVLSSTQNIDITPALKYDELKQNYGLKQIVLKRESLTVSYIASSIMHWKYIFIIPSSTYADKANRVRDFTVLCLIISILLGAVISFMFTKRNYKPINRLVQRLTMSSGLSRHDLLNEYSFIENVVDDTVKNNEKMDKLLYKQNNTMRSIYITKLLKGKINGNALFNDKLDSYDVNFVSEKFAVMIFFIEDCGNMDGEKLLLIQYAINNVVEELVNRNHHGYVVEIDDTMTCLINFNLDDANIGEMDQFANFTKIFMEEKFKVQLSVTMSMIHNGLNNIHDAYNEATEVMGYRFLEGNSMVLRYEDILKYKHNSENYYYPLEVEQQMVNYIKTGDLEKSSQLLNTIYEKNFTNGHLKVSLARCLIFDLVSTILKTLDEIKIFNDDLIQEEFSPIDRILRCSTVMDMKHEMNDILTKVCTFIQQKKNNHNMKTVNDICEYAMQHYSEESLCVTQIADHFQMNLSYISNLFKKLKGDGLYDFINRIRVDNAKRMLIENKYNIKDIAIQVGFYNNNSFIRVFKKYEGITPGKFKQMSANPEKPSKIDCKIK